MDLETRPVGRDELYAYVRSTRRVFGDPMDEESIRLELSFIEKAKSRTMAAFDRGDIVGTVTCHYFDMNVPGGRLALAGVSDVTTRATHRRRGVMSRLMIRALTDAKEEGQPLAALWASESGIYGRFGFGMAILQENWTIERKDTAFALEDDSRGELRFVEPRESARAFAEAYDGLCRLRPGMIDRNDLMWEVALLDTDEFRRGASEFYHAVYEEGGRVDGYLLYRLDGRGQLLRVSELVAATDAAYFALWRFCFGIDLMNTFHAANQPLDAPLPWMMAAPRQLQRATGEEFWLRIVDVEAALAGRGYSTEDRISLELRDPLCPWNDGVVVLEGGPEGAVCRRTEGGGDLAMDIADLAAAFLGAVGFSTLARAGRVDEHIEGALRRADAMFATDLKPWCIVQF